MRQRLLPRRKGQGQLCRPDRPGHQNPPHVRVVLREMVEQVGAILPAQVLVHERHREMVRLAQQLERGRGSAHRPGLMAESAKLARERPPNLGRVVHDQHSRRAGGLQRRQHQRLDGVLDIWRDVQERQRNRGLEGAHDNGSHAHLPAGRQLDHCLHAVTDLERRPPIQHRASRGQNLVPRKARNTAHPSAGQSSPGLARARALAFLDASSPSRARIPPKTNERSGASDTIYRGTPTGSAPPATGSARQSRATPTRKCRAPGQNLGWKRTVAGRTRCKVRGHAPPLAFGVSQFLRELCPGCYGGRRAGRQRMCPRTTGPGRQPDRAAPGSRCWPEEARAATVRRRCRRS